MQISPNLIEGVVTGIVGASFLGIFSIFKNQVKTLVLKWKLRRKVGKVRCGASIDGVSVSIENLIGIPFRIREVLVSMSAEGSDHRQVVELVFTGTLKTVQEENRKEQRKLIERLKKLEREGGKPEEVLLETRLGHQREMLVHPDPDGSVSLRPYMSASYLLPASGVTMMRFAPIACTVLVEFRNCSGSIELMEIKSQAEANRMLLELYLHLLKDMKSGQFNQARKRFGMEPLHVPQEHNFSPTELNGAPGHGSLDQPPMPSQIDKKAILRLPTGLETTLENFELTLGELIQLARTEFDHPSITPVGFGATNHFFFVNTSTGSLIDSNLDLRRPLSTMFISDGHIIDLRLSKPSPGPDGMVLNPMRGVTKYVR